MKTTRIPTIVPLALSMILSFHAGNASAAGEAAIGFSDEETVRNDLLGALAGMVKFAQTHTIDPGNNGVRELPSLVTGREALVMFIPRSDMSVTSLKLEASHNGTVLGVIDMSEPKLFPKSDQNTRDGRSEVQYSTRAWSATLPWTWMKNGLSLSFIDQQGKKGVLAADKIEFGPAAQLVLQNIRIGMLTPPGNRADHWFEDDPGRAGIDYFQKVPVSRLVVAQYKPIHLDRVVLPSGVVYTTASSTAGGVYEGDMREHIGKSLISVGINNANFGIVDSAGEAQEQPSYYHQVVVHTNRGIYTNGLQVHGLSGGNGMATLYRSDGNEFSHELGHAHSLGHYPGGGEWSVHDGNSGWGYDAYRKRMVGNLVWDAPAEPITIEGVVTPPFKDLYTFNRDAMAGGAPSGSISRLTHHTGYSAKRIQQYFAGLATVDPRSPSGYRKWNPTAKLMEVYQDGARRIPVRFGIRVMTLVGFYDPQGLLLGVIYPPLHGNYGHVYDLPVKASQGCWLDVAYNSTVQSIKLHAARYNPTRMNKFHVNLPLEGRNYSSATVICLVNGKAVEQAKIALTPQTDPLPDPVVIGEEAEYAQAAARLRGFAELQDLENRRFNSLSEFEKYVSNIYGPIHTPGQSAGRRAGDVFAYQDPATIERRYFMMKTSTYASLPTSAQDTPYWRYLGTMDTYVPLLPNPFAHTYSATANLHERMAKYYQVAQIATWSEQNRTGQKPGSVYVYDNPYSKKREYFMLKTSTYWYFPTDGKDNQWWRYMGDEATMKKWFMVELPTAQTFDQLVVQWYGVDRLHTWGENNRQGIPGQLFAYDHNGRRDYFQLKQSSYWYFPTNQTSNNAWEYLGTYR
jgi:hypothetical protein